MTFNQAAEFQAKKIIETLIKKQYDYGKENILSCPVGAEMGIIVRLSDKLNRLANLYKLDRDPKNESLMDSWLDITVYGLIGMMLQDKSFQLPLEEEND